ncbi:MAG TPA: hypothetical protein VIF82_18305 [Burkholderiaceae bacterium]|jgi:hypothetical protein
MLYLFGEAKNHEKILAEQSVNLRDAFGRNENVAANLLRRKYGDLSAVEYIAVLRLDCTEAQFHAAMSGMGKREHRVQIALSLEILPSVLTKNRSFMIRKADDQSYFMRLRHGQ